MWQSSILVVALTAVSLICLPSLVHVAPTGDAAPEVISSPSSSPLEELTVVEHEIPSQQPLPDTSAITGEMTEKLGVTGFFSLWLVFNDPAEIDLQTGTEFAILAPRQPAPTAEDAPSSLVRRMLLDHVVLGQRLRLAGREDHTPFTVSSLGGREINFQYRDGHWLANGAQILEPETEVSSSGELVVLDSYLFSDYSSESSAKSSSPDPVLEPVVTISPPAKSTTEAPKEAVPEALSVITVENAEEEKKEEDTTSEAAPTNLVDQLTKFHTVFNLSRVPIFNKYLAEAGVNELLEPGQPYTVLLPMDKAFQRWHPIDWGFYPFSVPEFTAEIVRSHFIKGALTYDNIEDNQTVTTITNRTVTFHKTPGGDLTANGVPLMRREVPLAGNSTAWLIPELLFVTHEVVQELRSHNKDKETPPLLAFPWWNAQFLSHAYLAIEKEENLTVIERLMNVAANLHLKVPGKNYTFLVPNNKAFESADLTVPMWWSDRGAPEMLPSTAVMAVERFLLHHLVPGRIYMRELTPGRTLVALDNSSHLVSQQEDGTWTVDDTRHIVKGDVFVYNLGTMLYLDGVLGSETIIQELREALALPQPTPPPIVESDLDPLPEPLNSELSEEGGNGSDVLLEDSTTTTTTAAPATSHTSSTSTNAVNPSSVTAQTERSSTLTVTAGEEPKIESNDIPLAVPPTEP